LERLYSAKYGLRRMSFTPLSRTGRMLTFQPSSYLTFRSEILRSGATRRSLSSEYSDHEAAFVMRT
jgi:hypothetical protein